MALVYDAISEGPKAKCGEVQHSGGTRSTALLNLLTQPILRTIEGVYFGLDLSAPLSPRCLLPTPIDNEDLDHISCLGMFSDQYSL